MEKFKKALSKVLIISLITTLVLFGMNSFSKSGVSAAGTGNFVVSGNNILDPNGNLWVGKGMNVPGVNWFVNRDYASSTEVDLVTSTWKCNIIRDCCEIHNNNTPWTQYTINNDTDKTVNAYTAKQCVVMFEAHDQTGSYFTDTSTPSITDLQNWWVNLANKYKNNPYVWFDIMNEPGYGGAIASQPYYSMFSQIIAAIRATGAQNIIVVDGACWGQETNTVANSGILTYGQQLLNGDPCHNIVFSQHIYESWNNNAAGLAQFADTVRGLGLCLMYGEFGFVNGSNNCEDAVRNAFPIANARNMTKIEWTWSGEDANKLCTNGTTGGDAIRMRGSNPGNLTAYGTLVWNDYHGIPNPTPTPAPTPVPLSVLDNFEGYSGSNTNLQNAYVKNTNGNTVTVTLDTTNKVEGSYGMKYAYTIGTPNFAGVTKNLAGGNDATLSGSTGIQLWVKPDGSNRQLTIQLTEDTAHGSEPWEAYYTLSGTTAQTLSLPFSSFVRPSWYTGGNGVMDLSNEVQYSIYLNQGSGTTGSSTIYLDNIKTY